MMLFFLCGDDGEIFCGDDGERLLRLKMWKRCHRVELTHVSSRVLLPFGNPKSNNNGK